MEIEKIMKECPKAIELVSKWFYQKMLESIPNEVDDKHKKNFSFNKEAIDSQLAIILESAPRALLDVFDEQEIYIQILITETPIQFMFSINTAVYESNYDVRLAAEKAAIKQAFSILETKLTKKNG